MYQPVEGIKVVYTVSTQPFGLYDDLKKAFPDTVDRELHAFLDGITREKYYGHDNLTTEVVLTD